MSDAFGVAITSVAESSAAARARLQPGDSIAHVYRQLVALKAEFDARIANVFDTIALTVWRNGRLSLVAVERDA